MERLSARENNLNLLRMLAAVAVVVSHAYPLSLGPGSYEPLTDLFGFSLGSAAVIVFFAVSGFLITKSYDTSGGDIVRYSVARFLRLYPALLVAALLTAFVLGPAYSTLRLSDYLLHRESWTYTPLALSLKYVSYDLPGVFVDNPFPRAVNGSLWTLYFEVLCYFWVAALGIVGILRPKTFWIFAFLFASLYYCVRHRLIRLDDHYVELTLPFILGSAAYVYRASIRLSWLVGGALVALAVIVSPSLGAQRVLWTVAIGYTALWFGAARIPLIRSYNRLGDYSYGTYIYAFPVQQAIVAVLPGISPLHMVMLAIPIVIMLAALSWYYVERPALSRRQLLDQLLRRQKGPI